jgi:hypothetical protein
VKKHKQCRVKKLYVHTRRLISGRITYSYNDNNLRDMSECFQLDMNDVILKPYLDPEKILSNIRTIEISYFRFTKGLYKNVKDKSKEDIKCWLLTFFPKYDFSYLDSINHPNKRDVRFFFNSHYVMYTKTLYKFYRFYQIERIKTLQRKK